MAAVDCVVVGDQVVVLDGAGPWLLGTPGALPLAGGRSVRLVRIGDQLEVRDLDGELLSLHGQRRARHLVNLDDCVGIGRTQLLMASLPLKGQPTANTPALSLATTIRWQSMLATARVSRSQLSEIARAAGSDAPVFVGGESGTGKELAARAIHAAGARRGRSFVALNCAALPESLAESELFGVERGAYTGAMRARPGAFAQANGGTLFLDEIGELSPLIQAKLLRVLESGEMRTVGGERTQKVDVRVVTASWQDLDDAAENGSFRHDLLHRLCVLRVSLAPLRERAEDILPLVHEMLRAKDATALMPDATLARRLAQAVWPGNIRELNNCVERAVAAHDPQALTPRDRPASTERTPRSRELLATTLTHCRGNRRRAATALGVSRSTLYRWMHDNAAHTM